MDFLVKPHEITRVPIRGERRLGSVVDVTTEGKNWYDTREGSKAKEHL